MGSILLGIPVLVTALILQVSLLSRIPMQHGTVDLLLLIIAAWAIQGQVKTGLHWAIMGGTMVAVVSSLPFFVFPVTYLVVAVMARLIQRRVWQAPILAMLFLVFIGSFIEHALSFGALVVTGVPLSIGTVLQEVLYPSVVLNLLFALPVYAIIHDFTGWFYPVEAEE